MPEATAPVPLLVRSIRSFEHLRFVHFDGSGSILEANEVFAGDFDTTPERLRGTPIGDLLTDDGAADLDGWVRNGLPAEPVILNFTRRRSATTLRCLLEQREDGVALLAEAMSELEDRAAGRMLELNNEMAVLSRENTRRRRELERALEELRTTHWHLKRIQEILPVCMGCEKIKTGSTSWKSLVDYLHENDIFVSHGYCPPCAEEYARRHGLEDDKR